MVPVAAPVEAIIPRKSPADNNTSGLASDDSLTKDGGRSRLKFGVGVEMALVDQDGVMAADDMAATRDANARLSQTFMNVRVLLIRTEIL